MHLNIEEKYLTIFTELIKSFKLNRCFGSKSAYRYENENNYIIFNANICINDIDNPGKLIKIWYGDIDITKEGLQLKELANNLNTTFYVLHEMDARFGNEDKISIKEEYWNTKDSICGTVIEIFPEKREAYEKYLKMKQDKILNENKEKEVIKLLKKTLSLKTNDIIGCYLFGSRLYRTHNDNSDFDFICIVENYLEDKINQFKDKEYDNRELKHNDLNVHIYTKDEFQKSLDEHEIKMLEIYYNNQYNKDFNFTFKLDKTKLRKEISSISNNSWVKCKKKLTVEENQYDIGIKSLYHAFRIVDFGIQIAKMDTIYNFAAYDFLLKELKENHYTWEELYDKYKKKFNAINSEFKKYCPK